MPQDDADIILAKRTQREPKAYGARCEVAAFFSERTQANRRATFLFGQTNPSHRRSIAVRESYFDCNQKMVILRNRPRKNIL
jgi:hypothetical protein